jgi:trimeric autotransporter adhesin
LTVNGVIEMLSGGGLKFPDGTVQTTAGLTGVSRDGSLKGDGTPASRLGLALPLVLVSPFPTEALIVANNNANGHTMRIWGGSGPNGLGLRVTGGAGATGLETSGGEMDGANGGRGLSAFGGSGTNANGGTGVIAIGGSALGSSTTTSSGHGIEAFAGFAGFAIKGKAGLFHGNVQVNGVLSKAGGSFKIDHPLDPENRYLSHSFVESPDMMNIYNGSTTTDHNGLSVVELPDYFESLNRDFRYQLTVVGQFAQAIIAEKVKDNRFTIQTSAPGVEVSWQVTGIRQDAWANKNRIPVEEVKSEKERGHYLHPDAFGKEEERSIEWANQPEMMREMKQRRLEAEQRRQPRN